MARTVVAGGIVVTQDAARRVIAGGCVIGREFENLFKS